MQVFFKFLLVVHFNFRCYPRLNEGDQVVMINDRDVSQHTHDQVVNFIRASSEPHSAQLTLAVRQVSHYLISVSGHLRNPCAHDDFSVKSRGITHKRKYVEFLVVNIFIRASSEPHSAQLTLAVRQVSLKYFLKKENHNKYYAIFKV